MPFQPLQFGMPGGPELIVILLMVLMMGIPILIIVLAVFGAAKLMGGSEDDQVRELEQRVARLEGQLDALEDNPVDEDNPADEDGSRDDTDEGYSDTDTDAGNDGQSE